MSIKKFISVRVFTSVITIILAIGLLFLEHLRNERTVVFQLHPVVNSKFEILIENKPRWMDGFSLHKHETGDCLWEFQIPINLSFAKAKAKKLFVLDRIRDWIDKETPMLAKNGLFIHDGHENMPVENGDEWSDAVVSFLMQAVKRE